MDGPLNMTACASPLSLHGSSSDDTDATQSSGIEQRPDIRRRRHSHFIPRRRKSIVSSIMEGEEAVIMKVGEDLEFHFRITPY